MTRHQMVPEPRREVGVCQLPILQAQPHLDSQRVHGLEVPLASGGTQVLGKEVLPTPQAGVPVPMLPRGPVALPRAGQVLVSNLTVGMYDCSVSISVGCEETVSNPHCFLPMDHFACLKQ
jgi:hypothetical protein